MKIFVLTLQLNAGSRLRTCHVICRFVYTIIMRQVSKYFEIFNSNIEFELKSKYS